MCSCSGGVTVASGCPALRRARSAKAPASSASVAAADSKASHHGSHASRSSSATAAAPPARRSAEAAPARRSGRHWRRFLLERAATRRRHTRHAGCPAPASAGRWSRRRRRTGRTARPGRSGRAQVGEHPDRRPPWSPCARRPSSISTRSLSRATTVPPGSDRGRQRQRARASAEVEDPPLLLPTRSPGDRADDVEDHGEPLLAVRHVPLLYLGLGDEADRPQRRDGPPAPSTTLERPCRIVHRTVSPGKRPTLQRPGRTQH